MLSQIVSPLKTNLMAEAAKVMTVPDEVIVNKIYLVRGQKVMIDRDLAELYGVETKRLKEAVRRNAPPFPSDFLFEMNKQEFENWRTHFASSNSQDKKGLRYAPFCFTEQGVTMLSCVLNSERAIAVNIRIIRVFTKMREMLLSHKDILIKLEQIEKKLLQHDVGIDKQGDDVQLIFQALKQLLNPPQEPRPRIGFRRKEEQS
jgi:phage regulator Rha-like protein